MIKMTVILFSQLIKHLAEPRVLFFVLAVQVVAATDDKDCVDNTGNL